MAECVLRDLIDCGLDAMNVDVKGNANMVKNFCGIDNEKVWKNIIFAKEHGVHVEITTLLLEGFNSEYKTIKKISERILEELGEETLYHITRAFPRFHSREYGFNHTTQEPALYKARKIALKSGLKFVYLGNMESVGPQNTVCPDCSHVVIERDESRVLKEKLDNDGNCRYCGHFISVL